MEIAGFEIGAWYYHQLPSRSLGAAGQYDTHRNIDAIILRFAVLLAAANPQIATSLHADGRNWPIAPDS